MSKPLREAIEEILKELAPTAEESSHITGTEPFYAIKESDLPKLISQILELFETRKLTPNQKRVLREIRATLSPRLTDLMRNTGFKNGTTQSALRGLMNVGLVEKKGKIYVEKKVD